MDNAVRYEIIAEIAQGDFATVFRARDRQLGREVAIKQLHEQYLHNPKLTERYWQEAQMIARLEHPHVMTIYDVVPERGWLILELMKGSIKDLLKGHPIKLSDLRLTILFAARALSFFQQHEILHGDVKPSNLLVDRNNWIKLGDFGIARRIQGDDGSAIKGTTRYIAPEVVSDKFGPVGPHSDIYSLGFSAYELLCGSRFDTLFPGLNMFGRDQQLAWMMWHSAPDRRLPRIRDVLDGVPEDLAAVIERMTCKDPRQRYRSADQVIADLECEGGPTTADLSRQDEEEARRAAKKARRKRLVTIAAMTLSIVLSASVLFWPPKKPLSQPEPVLPTEGLVGKVVADQSTIFLKSEERIVVGENDLILLDGVLCQLDALLPNDQLAIKYLRGPDGTIKRIMATRDSSRTFAGQLQEIDPAGSQIALAADDQAEPQRFAFDGETAVLLNGKPATTADLRVGDSLLLHFRGSGTDVKAERLEAKRQLTASGVLESFDPTTREIAFRTGQEVVKRTLADQCQIRLNKRANLAGRAITLADLTSGDQIVSLTYDSHVLSMDLQRELSDVAEVWSVDRAASRLTVLLDGNQVGVSTGEARIAYQGQPVELGFVRKGDRLVIAHDSPDRRDVAATSIEVTDLVRDPRVTAIVIAQQAYDGVQVTPYEFAVRDAGLVRAALDTNARVPEPQLIQLTDQTRDGLAQAVNDFLAAQQQGTQLIVYFVGQAYVDMSTGTPYLAGRDFSLENIKETGLKLRDLIGRLEQVQAREKVLILDTCHKVSANETQAQPSTEEQVRSAMVGEAVSRSVTVIASCGAGQRGGVDSQRQQGLFGIELAQALSGKADADGDQHVSADELFRYLEQQLAGQQPVLFSPDTRPRRLSPEAGDAVRQLLVELDRVRPSKEFDDALAGARQLAGSEPDVDLAGAIIKLKAGKTGESFDTFNSVLASRPDTLVAYHGVVYQRLVKKEWDFAADTLGRLVERIAMRGARGERYVMHLLQFAGTVREYLATVVSNANVLRAVDAAVEKLGAEERNEFEAGKRVFAERLAQTPAGQRDVLRNYYRFDFTEVRDYLIEQLEK